MSKQDALPLKVDPSEMEESSTSQPSNRHGDTILRFRGLLLCRRCDFCGTRIGVHGESKDRVTMKCPACQREYVFFELSQ